jgi:hypothetical protein
MPSINIPDSIMDTITRIAAIESTTPERFIHDVIVLAIGRVERKQERGRKPRTMRLYVKKGDTYVLNPVVARQQEFSRLMRKPNDE